MPTKNGRATIIDVAREAGVSVSTVSRVINGKGDVSPRAREAVLQALAATSYRASPVARSLVGGRTRLIGLHSLHPTQDYSAALIPGVLDICEQAGYGVLWSAAHFGSRTRNQAAPSLGSLTDGLLVVAPSLEAEADLEEFAGRPVVIIEPWQDQEGQVSLTAANREGAIAATRYLLDLGHRRIGFITGRMELSSARERLEGFRAAMAAFPLDPALIVQGRFNQESGLVAARSLLALHPRPTAIIASNDEEAFGTLWAARDAGLAVPQDLSVVGFDDLPLSAHLQPPLTTVRQPLYELGRRASEMLIGWIEGKTPEPSRVVLPTELVVRASCAPPRGSAVPG